MVKSPRGLTLSPQGERGRRLTHRKAERLARGYGNRFRSWLAGHRRRIVFGVPLLLLLGFVGWFAVSGYRAQEQLTVAKDHAQLAKAALLRADGTTAQQEVDLAVANAGAARQLSRSSSSRAPAAASS